MPPFAIEPPIEPMLAKLAAEVPDSGGYLFEPKWDGFRAIVFRGGGEVYIQSRDLKPLDRYFPELSATLMAGLPDGCVLDGEIVIATPRGLDFDALQMRLHPAASRVAKLSVAIPASFVAFDVIAANGQDLRDLTQAERRLVMGVAFVVFLVLNFLLIWPQFGELSRTQLKSRDVSSKLVRFQNEVRKKPDYERELKRLEGAGGYVASEEQALALSREVVAQAALSGVHIDRYDPQRASGPQTNSFFEEQSLTITVNTGEQELVDFLYNLGASNSLIRVRTMTLGRDPSQMHLAGTITLVKSFQKKAPTKPVATASNALKTTNPPPKSVAAPSVQTNPPAVKVNPSPAKPTPKITSSIKTNLVPAKPLDNSKKVPPPPPKK